MSGVVRDANGAPLAGATVRISSAQTTRTVITGSDGAYRFGLLNPGAWTIRVTKDSFQGFSSNVTVLTNADQTVNVKMVQETGATVVVTATLTSVDQTTTQTGLSVTTDTIASIPKGRDLSNLAYFAPGVVGGGFGGYNDPSIGGGSIAENSYVLDGLTTTDFRRGTQGAALVTDFIDQVEIQTGGFKPEFSALGGVFNAVTKSGTNTTTGAAWMTWDAIGIQAVPKKSAYFRQADPNSRFDIGASLGGAIIKDKWFYFVGVDLTKTEAPGTTPNLYNMTNSKFTQDNLQVLLKTNWYLTPDHQLTLSLQNNNVKSNQDHAYSFYGPQELGAKQTDKTLNWNINYDWTISPQLFLSAKLGATTYSTDFVPTNGTTPRVFDNVWNTIGPGHNRVDTFGFPYRYGGIGYYIAEDKNTTTQGRVDLSAFLGSHNLKFGISQITSKYTEVARTSGGSRYDIRSSGGNFNGVDKVTLSTNATVKAVFTAFYAQDTWEVQPGFRLMYGFRWEIQEQKDLNDKAFMKFSKFPDYVQPRLGFTWDVFNNGKSKLSGSYATYYESIPQRIAIRVFANEVYLRERYSTSRSTYNAATGAWAITNPTPSSITDFATPFSFDPIAEGVKLPERQEYILGYDHTLDSGWTIGTHWKYRKLKNPIEDMVFTDSHGNPYDEGPGIVFSGTTPLFGAGAAVLGNPGAFQQWRPNSKSMTLYLLGLGETHNNYGINMLDYYNPRTGLFTVGDTFFTKAGNTYYSADVTIDKKTERAYFSFSYTWSRLEGNYEGVVSSSNGQADNNITASFDYYPYVGTGLLPLDRTNVAKVQASYRFDVFGRDLNGGLSWTYQSGTPVSLFDDGSTSEGNPPGSGSSLDIGGYGNAVPANGMLGQYGRTPALNNVDLHLDYVLKFGKGVKVQPSVDIFNLFNTRYATGVLQQATDQSGSADIRYGQATGWQVGRRYRFGVKINF
jgi:hypothetical protein